MTTRLLFAVTIASGLAVAPAAFAEDAMKPGTSKTKTHKSVKVHRKIDRAPRSSGKINNKNDTMMGEPYSTQKDEMTR